MLNPIVLFLLFISIFPAVAVQNEAGSEYEGWCSHQADSEKIEAIHREDYIQACIASLEEADSKPNSNKGKRKSNDDDGD